MTNPASRLVRPTSHRLLSRLLETPDLVSAVQALPARALGQLIGHLGLEDSGELVALATTEQLVQVFDDELWQKARPGDEERFDSDRFALWLEVLLEAGEELAARKLAELPFDLVTLGLHRLLLVLDLDELRGELSDESPEVALLDKALDSHPYHELLEFQVIARRHDGWDALLGVLLALDQEHHELLRRILTRCSHLSAGDVEAQGGLYAVLTAEETLETDVAAEREDRRAEQGFVASQAAASFLALARTAPATEREARERDPVTRAYFRELRRVPAEATAGQSPSVKGRGQATAPGALLDLLREAEVLAPVPVAPLLEAHIEPGVAGDPGPFRGALRALYERDAALHASRMEELAYLANVLVAGCTVAGRPFRPLEAAEAAVAICNLGLELLEETEERRDATQAPALASVAADVLFRLGWARLHRLGEAAASSVERLLVARQAALAGTTEARRVERAIAEVRSAMRAGRPWRARRQLATLQESLDETLDPADLEALRGLLEECPQRAGALRTGAERRELAFIARCEELEHVSAFLGRLAPEDARPPQS
ncbi:MAG: hypothetical protein IT371_27620 [Deltaproteobacteria bacterium]|nr:hypothetical protein [Deltaproteobacteria bacterium]